MSLPAFQMDFVLLISLLVIALVAGALTGWILAYRRVVISQPHENGGDPKPLLQLMSRADHGLDNYITSIQGHLAVLGEDLPTDIQRWQISREAISQAAIQMKRHLERLRLIRMGLDETSLRVAPVNLVRLIENILIVLEPAATERNIKLRMEVQKLTQPVSGDPQMFEELFTTLLDNAIKHNPPETEVVAELTRRNGMALALISDNGKGMDEELLTRIFDEGERDRGAGTARGTGMGLYIANMLVNLHGGTLSVESQPGEGSVFSVALPFDKWKK